MIKDLAEVIVVVGFVFFLGLGTFVALTNFVVLLFQTFFG